MIFRHTNTHTHVYDAADDDKCIIIVALGS